MESNLYAKSDEALASFLDALRAIPNDEKGAYLTALSRCPKLVQTESSVSRFLRHDKCDVESASRRFVDYWEKRKSVFGHHRAFLPMTLSKGAMSESCIALIRAGWIAPLPPDENGRRVCFLDMTIEEIRYQHSHEDRLCCLFFALQVMSEDLNAQTQGFNFIILYDELCYAPKSAIEGFEEILRVMPVQVTDLHLIPSKKMKPNGDFFEEFVPRALKTLLSSNESDHDTILDTRQHIYSDESQESIIKTLGSHGMRKENLPAAIGGLWTCQHHNAWVKLRLAKEEELSKSHSNLEEVFFPDSSATTGISLTSTVRRRRREAKHSRQKRDRKRCRVKALLLHIKYLEQEKRQARSLTETLERGLAEAKKMIDQVGSPSPRLHANGFGPLKMQGSSSQAQQIQHSASSLCSPQVQTRALDILRDHQARLQAAESLQTATLFAGGSSLAQQTLAVSANGPVSVVVIPREELNMAHHAVAALGHRHPLSLPHHTTAAAAAAADNGLLRSSLYSNLAVERMMIQEAQAQQLLRAQQFAAARNLAASQYYLSSRATGATNFLNGSL